VAVKSGSNTVLKNAYDGLGRRVKIDVDRDQDEVAESYRHMYYNAGWQLLETRETTNDANEPEDLQPLCQYVWSARYIDAPVLRDGYGARMYYLTDANMNVTALVDDDSGTWKVAERYMYDPYGKVTTLNGAHDADGDRTEWTPDGNPDWQNYILYCGYYYGEETRLYHVRNRFYHAELGRWLQRDPAGYGEAMSLYIYACSAPTGKVDPAGLAPPPDWGVTVPKGPSSTPGQPNAGYDWKMMREAYNRSAWHWDRGEKDANRYWWEVYKKWQAQYLYNRLHHPGGRAPACDKVRRCFAQCVAFHYYCLGCKTVVYRGYGKMSEAGNACRDSLWACLNRCKKAGFPYNPVCVEECDESRRSGRARGTGPGAQPAAQPVSPGHVGAEYLGATGIKALGESTHAAGGTGALGAAGGVMITTVKAAGTAPEITSIWIRRRVNEYIWEHPEMDEADMFCEPKFVYRLTQKAVAEGELQGLWEQIRGRR
jgi:RHS repeat-associated protein